MKAAIEHRPDFAILAVDLDPGESIVAESGAMVAMDASVTLAASARGGLLQSMKRLAGGESLFQSTFTAQDRPGRVLLAPPGPGDILPRELGAGESLFIQSSCYLASEPPVKLDTTWGGGKGFFGGLGIFILTATGPGRVWCSSYGGVRAVRVRGEALIDTGHIVAFEPSLTCSIDRVRGLKGLLFSGEGLLCRFRGEGTVFAQTRSPMSLASFLHPFRRQKAASS